MSERLRLIFLALKQRCSVEQDWFLSSHQRVWLTSKCILSIILNHRVDLNYSDNPIDVAYYDFYKTNSFEFGEGGEWEVLQTPKKGFGYSITSTGYP